MKPSMQAATFMTLISCKSGLQFQPPFTSFGEAVICVDIVATIQVPVQDLSSK